MFLAAIAVKNPLLLLLDDLHWADTATLDLLCHLAQHQAVSRLYILGAYRSDELASHSALERSILDLTRSRQLTVLGLRPLPEADVAELRRRSEEDIRAAQQQALADLQASVKGLVFELAEKVVERNLDRETNMALIESYISQVGSGRT